MPICFVQHFSVCELFSGVVFCCRHHTIYVCACSNVDIHALKREAEFYCITPLGELTVDYLFIT